MKPLAIIPLYISDPQDLEVVRDCLKSLKDTAEGECDVLVVDDASPRQDLVDALESLNDELGFELQRSKENQGFSRTINVGLRRCLQEGRDAILVNADLEFIHPGWVRAFREQKTSDGKGLASVVGALLIYPSGLIQHAGIFFSLLHRCFSEIYKYAPHDLPEAKHPRVCPVTGALQFIRHDCLASVGIYDEQFRLGWEDVDYCVRVWLTGRECIYQPKVRAVHFESMFRGRGSDKVEEWTRASWAHFCEKYKSQSFAGFVPSVI